MPRILRAIGDEFKSRVRQKDTASVNRFEGFQGDGAIVLRDRRGTARAEIPAEDEKGFGGGNPLAIYKPTGAKSVSAAKAMARFNDRTFAAVNAIASEVSNIQLRLYQVQGGRPRGAGRSPAFDAARRRQRAHDQIVDSIPC